MNKYSISKMLLALHVTS